VTAPSQDEAAATQDRQRAAAALALVRGEDQRQDDLDRIQFRADQSFIAQFVMWVFGISVCATIVAVLIAPLVTPDWKSLVPLMLDIIKVAVVPMVALVIGYYLPKSGR
jgi:hypothetical protein